MVRIEGLNRFSSRCWTPLARLWTPIRRDGGARNRQTAINA